MTQKKNALPIFKVLMIRMLLTDRRNSGLKVLLNNIKAGAADPTSYIGAGLLAVGKRVSPWCCG